MKVAITATEPSLESAVDPRFGRAQHFIVADTETDEWSAHDNSKNLNAAQGAGVQAAQNVAGLGVLAVITGNVGPKALTALQAAGISIYLCPGGTVQDALNSLRAGSLELSTSASVSGHW